MVIGFLSSALQRLPLFKTRLEQLQKENVSEETVTEFKWATYLDTQDRDRRQEAIETIQKISEHSPTPLLEHRNLLLRELAKNANSDEDYLSLSIAVRNLCRSNGQRMAGDIENIVDISSGVPVRARRHLLAGVMHIGAADPGALDRVRTDILSFTKDSDAEVRGFALHALQILARTYPQAVAQEDELRQILDLTTDQISRNRRYAFEILYYGVGEAPKIAPECIECARRPLREEWRPKKERQAAARLLSRASFRAPTTVSQSIEEIRDFVFDDTAEVRRYVTRGIVGAIIVSPTAFQEDIQTKERLESALQRHSEVNSLVPTEEWQNALDTLDRGRT